MNILEERLSEILQIAMKYHVTDIHFTCSDLTNNDVRMEMRVNGVMRPLKQKSCDARLFRYLMYRSNLDVSNVLLPQTGSFEQKTEDGILSLRFSLVSSHYRTSGVLRLLNHHKRLQIENLSMQKDVIQWLSSITDHVSGLFVFSGPTGSGKTTSLYTILNACRGKKIFTLEDPVEVVNDHYVQLQINEKQNLSYADGIRQLMRHDPDIIMIGEIRDETAAQMAVRCALTGHLVVTSIHSSSCTSAIQRLLDLGVKNYQLQDVLCGISTQRLFTMNDGTRFSIFEFMDRKEITHYFAYERHSEGFRTLAQNVEDAWHNGYISRSQAEKYLSD